MLMEILEEDVVISALSACEISTFVRHVWAPRPATPTVKRALSDLSGDLGPLGLLLGLGAMALVLLGGLVDPVGTRATYLSLVLFHGWLEIAVVAHLLANRR